MDCTNYTTERRRGQHLTFEERVIIRTRWNDGWNNNQIAKEIGWFYNCIKTEIARSMMPLYNGKVMRYKARTGQMVYELNRSKCVRSINLMNCIRFIRYVEQKFEEENWSLDACAKKALESGEFTREEIVCTKTEYGQLLTRGHWLFRWHHQRIATQDTGVQDTWWAVWSWAWSDLFNQDCMKPNTEANLWIEGVARTEKICFQLLPHRHWIYSLIVNFLLKVAGCYCNLEFVSFLLQFCFRYVIIRMSINSKFVKSL